MSDGDLSLPRNRSLAGAHAAGFEARLAGRSIYSNPYADAIEREAEDAGRARDLVHPLDPRPRRSTAGWRYAFLNAWWEGWRAADSLVDPAPLPDKLPRGKRTGRRTT